MPSLVPRLVVAWLAAAPQADPAAMVAGTAEDAAAAPARPDDAGTAAVGTAGGAAHGGNASPPADEPAVVTPDDDGLHPGWFYGTLAAAVVFGIAGATTGGMALGERDEYSSALSACRGGDASACRIGPSIVADYELYATLTNVLLPCAGAFALAGLVLAFLTDFGGGDADAADDGDTYFTFFGASAGAGAALVLRF